MMAKLYAWACLCGFQTDTATSDAPACRDCRKPMFGWLSRHSARSGVTADEIKAPVWL